MIVSAGGIESASDLPGSLGAWLEYLESLHPRGQAGIQLGLDRVQAVKAELGQTQQCPVIVVAGTNGKGSTVAYLEAILALAGYRVATYTSPHLLSFGERVRINRTSVPDEDLAAAFGRVEMARRRAGQVALTYFEFSTLGAWEVFAAAQADVIVLEVGLGGRLDAVNAYDADVAVVTTVDLDHMDWLGETREAIGFEKAGIFRSGRPALCADLSPPGQLVDHAAAIGAELRLIGRDFGFRLDDGNRAQWHWWHIDGEGKEVRRTLAYPSLRGSAQLHNASVALAALEALRERLPVTMSAIRRGLIEVELAGRFQVLPGRPAIVLDVAHNPQAARVLVANLGDMGFFDRTYAVVGMLSDKDIRGTLVSMRGRVDRWYLADLGGPRGLASGELAQLVDKEELGGEVFCFPSPRQAYEAAQGQATESDRIVVFGSFLTVAGVMEALRDGR